MTRPFLFVVTHGHLEVGLRTQFFCQAALSFYSERFTNAPNLWRDPQIKLLCVSKFEDLALVLDIARCRLGKRVTYNYSPTSGSSALYASVAFKGFHSDLIALSHLDMWELGKTSPQFCTSLGERLLVEENLHFSNLEEYWMKSIPLWKKNYSRITQDIRELKKYNKNYNTTSLSVWRQCVQEFTPEDTEALSLRPYLTSWGPPNEKTRWEAYLDRVSRSDIPLYPHVSETLPRLRERASHYMDLRSIMKLHRRRTFYPDPKPL